MSSVILHDSQFKKKVDNTRSDLGHDPRHQEVLVFWAGRKAPQFHPFFSGGTLACLALTGCVLQAGVYIFYQVFPVLYTKTSMYPPIPMDSRRSFTMVFSVSMAVFKSFTLAALCNASSLEARPERATSIALSPIPDIKIHPPSES